MEIGGLPNVGIECLDLLRNAGSPVGQTLGSVLNPQPNGRTASIPEVASAFEQVLMEMVMRSMRETVQSSELFGASLGEENYRGFLDSLYVELGAQGEGFGLREALIQQLNGVEGVSSTAEGDS